MSDNTASSSTPANDPNTTPVVTPQPPPQSTPAGPITPAPIAALTPLSTSTMAPPKGVPNPWAQQAKPAAGGVLTADVKQSGDPLPTGVMPRPNLKVDVQRAIETERVERAERPTPNGLPSARNTASSNAASNAANNATVLPQSVADAPTSPPVVTSVVPRVEDAQTGPITKRQRAFFASPPKLEISTSRKAPLVPLPKPGDVRPSDRLEMSGGVVVIERTSTAWIATAAVAIAGIVIALVLALDASAANEKLVAKEAEAAELAKRVAELEKPKPAPVAVEPAAPAPAPASDAQPLALALRARLPDAKIAVDGAQVTVTLDNLLDKKGRLSKRAAEVLGRVGAALGPVASKVEVVAYSDGNVGRGKTEWGQSAARATNVARALAGVDAKKIAVVGKTKGASARRIDLVVTGL